MNKFLLSLLLATAATAANADAIVATAKVDGTTVAVESSLTSTLNVNSQSFGPDFNLNTLSINSQQSLAPGDILATNTLDVNQTVTGSHQLVIDILATGLTGPGALRNLLSSFSVSGMTAGWSAREETFINNNLLADTGTFSQPSDSAFSTNPALLTNPFNAEVIYTINATGTGRFNGGIDISNAAVPGPTVGAGIPGMIAGLSLLGLARRRRRT